jgi:hypothetical protein
MSVLIPPSSAQLRGRQPAAPACRAREVRCIITEFEGKGGQNGETVA